jgi:hypothetical protein
LTNQRLKHTAIARSSFCHEKTCEACAVKLTSELLEIVVICIYRAPSGDLVHFFLSIGTIIRLPFETNSNFYNLWGPEYKPLIG